LAIAVLAIPAFAGGGKDIVDTAVGAEGFKTKEVKTAEGDADKVVVKDGNVTIDGAKVVKTDIECSNGVIHVIDTVILPPCAK
jgi:transforming growth factor-beta-induced protein